VHPFAGAAYATSKAALASLTREMASDFGRVGVRVNSIAPGEIDTSILSPGTEKIVEQQIPLHRLGTPDEVAKIIYVLCTETSSYVNGAEIHINGGQHVSLLPRHSGVRVKRANPEARGCCARFRVRAGARPGMTTVKFNRRRICAARGEGRVHRC
jgi:short-subunit dehydrogenase